MADELRERLRRLDVTQPSIQGAANAMMKYYDRSPMTAVTEWRNALQTINDGDAEQHILALLYVANEVVQNSRRNRGKKFVDLFTPILGQSLVYMAQTPELTEKIRRVVKIWGDRRVFHMKDINDWMVELEPYRQANRNHTRGASSSSSARIENDGARFSPDPMEIARANAAPSPSASTNSSQGSEMNVATEDAGLNESQGSLDHNSVDNDDLFGDDSERQTLQIELSVDDVAALSDGLLVRPPFPTATTTSSTSPDGARQKRRRSSASTGSKKIKVLSMPNLLEICNQLADNQQKFELAQMSLQRIAENVAATTDDDLSNLVGDALQEAVSQNETDLRNMMMQKRILHALANERRALGQEATRYLPWLEAALVQDDDDLAFAATLQEKIAQFQPIHVQLQSTRNTIRQESRRHAALEAEQERKRKEAEDAERFRQQALARENEEKPGMVWNPSTREYQALNTDESWRD